MLNSGQWNIPFISLVVNRTRSKMTLAATMPSRLLHYSLALVLLLFLIAFAQGQGPGGCDTVTREQFSVQEEVSAGTNVGTIQTQSTYTYTFKEPQSLFSLNEYTGEIKTKVIINRESLPSNTIHILIIRVYEGDKQECPIEVNITILDINDNNPIFKSTNGRKVIQFNENANIGNQVPLDSVTDLDQGENGTIRNFQIVSATNTSTDKFELVLIENIPYIKTIGSLDREKKEFYQINISCEDAGSPPLKGYLTVDIHIEDYNDHSPVFDPSNFVASINESSPTNTVVLRVEATDLDIGQNSELTYKLTDETGQFSINNKTGEITTLQSPILCTRRCERSTFTECNPSSCFLTIEVRDGGEPSLSGQAYVTVNVTDVNNNAPTVTVSYRPSSNKEFSTVDENANNSIVAVFSVRDSDKNINGEIGDVQIIGGNERGHFTLISFHSFKTNLIKVNGANLFDRERISSYNLTLMAADKGRPSKSSFFSILIYINDVNDHYPMFEKSIYRVTLLETSPVGSYVVAVVATDLDSGGSTGLTYGIVSENTTNPHQWFNIDQHSGLITVQNRIHYEINPQVTLNISVHDGSLIPFYNYTRLIITILDQNDNTPTFDRDIYRLNITEGNSIGSEVITMTASDADSSLNGTVTYQFLPSVEKRYPNTFLINPNLGKITTQVSLDREARSSYTLKVVASDQGTPSLSSTATIIISIQDVNDEIPSFYPTDYYVNILENRTSGISVVTVQAFDGDYGNDGTVVYSLLHNYQQFSIDSATGVIRTTQSLSRQQATEYTVRVQGKDDLDTHTDQATVHIKVIADNTVVPVFQRQPYDFTIEEGSAGRTVGSISAFSSGSVSLNYRFVGGDLEGVFSINPSTGEITTSKIIDREVKSVYNLEVIVSTDSIIGQTKVKVTVQDINDNSPQFSSSEEKVVVYENWPVGHEVFVAKATDMDAGANAEITYTLVSSPDIFAINQQDGMVYLAQVIQGILVREHTLTITATDKGGQSSSQQVHVTIADVNNHTPVFAHTNYEVSLLESVALNHQFFTFSATDADRGVNGEINYNITYGNIDRAFGLFPDGVMYLAQALDMETKDHYKLTITATDGGIPPRSSSSNITIQVLDSNDNRPFFRNASYTFYVEEDQLPGTAIGHVKALDTDMGRNAELSYSLDDNQDNFTINALTGEVTTLKSFDREELNRTTGTTYYTLTVYVSDNGLVKLSDSVNVRVYVTDVNDNAPMFEKKMYITSLQENSPVNTRVFKMKAIDIDDGVNAAVEYYIIAGNEDGHFVIDQSSGQILLQVGLDRDTQDTFILTVSATDKGQKVNFTTSTSITINVQDTNDNRPLFPQTLYDIKVPESTEPGENIAHFTADDIDLNENANITYSLRGVDNDGTFSIDVKSGKLYLQQPLDYEGNKNEYNLEILAEDNGTPTLSNYAKAHITVEDVNDNSPVFIMDMPTVVTVAEDIGLFTNILTLRAEDRDSGDNGQITFRIKHQSPPGNEFNIQSENKINNVVSLDRERTHEYTLIIVATDSAKPPQKQRSAEISVRILVGDINDNSPEFRSANAISVKYPTVQGKIGRVYAIDLDSGPNGTVAYELTAGDSSKFSIDRTSGDVQLTNNLPQSPVSYTLTVTARDGAFPSPRSVQMDVKVILVPTPSSDLIFSGLPYVKSLSERSTVNTPIVQVNSVSSETYPREYYITSVDSQNPGVADYFSMDISSGFIRTSRVLDREEDGDRFVVTVCVMERQSNQPRAATTQVSSFI